MSKRRPTLDSNTYRFFVDPQIFHGDQALIEDPGLIHQMNAVLRLSPGDRVTLLDGAGWQYIVSIVNIARNRVTGAVEHRAPAANEPHAHLTLYIGLMRPERFEWVIQKATELGASTLVPLICTHSIEAAVSERKHERWNKIVREAAEQSRRGVLPQLAPAIFFEEACRRSAETWAFLLWEGEGARSLRSALRERIAASEDTIPPISLFSGPEGGLTSNELQCARNYGIIPVTLGPRTLRAETAPLAATTAVLYELGDLD